MVHVARTLSLHYIESGAATRGDLGANREKNGGGERDPGAVPAFLPTYLPVLRLSNWLGTYVAKPQKYHIQSPYRGDVCRTDDYPRLPAGRAARVTLLL